MTKLVKVECSKGFKLFTKVIKPGEKYRLNENEIFKLMCMPGIRLYEIFKDGKFIRLTKSNYNKVNYVESEVDEAAKKAAEEEAAKKAEEEKKAAEEAAAKAEAEAKAAEEATDKAEETATAKKTTSKKTNKK